MLTFEEINLKHKQRFESCVAKECALNSISDFNFFYLWNTKSNIQIAFEDKYVVLKGVWRQKTYFYSPSMANVEDFYAIFDLLKNYMGDNNFYFAGLDKYIADKITNLPKNFTLSFDRNASDYVYLTSNLATLSGKKFHAKRNFVNSFIKNYKYQFVEYQPKYYDEVMALYDNWLVQSDHDVDKNEKIAIQFALKDYKELGMKIYLLMVDDKIIAFSASSISINGLAQVFFEKANVDYKGVFAMINNLTAKTFEGKSEYINREEDMGIEGLRNAKLSYNPTVIYEKYILEGKYE